MAHTVSFIYIKSRNSIRSLNFIIIRPEYEGTNCVGNHCLEGYAYDLIDEIANHLHFKYEFRLTPGNKYGAYHEDTKQWDGLIKDLLDHVSNAFHLIFHSYFYQLRIVIFRMRIWRYVT